MSDESSYKRAEDREWRQSVDARLVSLTSAQKNTDDILDEHGELLEQIEELLEGDPLKREDTGLKGDIRDISRAINELRAIMAPDHLGHGGIIHRLEAVEVEVGLRKHTSENRWKLILAVISATAIVTAALISNLDKMESFFKRQMRIGPLEQRIERSRGPKRKITHIRYRKVAPENDEHLLPKESPEAN